jgi:hypothetical protein
MNYVYVTICNVFRFICFHELFVRFVVTNKDKLVHISVLVFISALLSDPQAGQLHFIPGIGRAFPITILSRLTLRFNLVPIGGVPWDLSQGVKHCVWSFHSP